MLTLIQRDQNKRARDLNNVLAPAGPAPMMATDFIGAILNYQGNTQLMDN